MLDKKLNKVINKAKEIKIDDYSKIVIMSDVHRGVGDNADNFIKNKSIFNGALNYYFNKGFTYIELGDGDDMWEVRNYEEIVNEHIDTFKILKKFHDRHRLIMIYGNHDIVKRDDKVMKKYFSSYYDKITKERKDLLVNLSVKESLILSYKGHSVFLTHGHQVDFLNSNLWKLSRFLVRTVWRSLEIIGANDPTKSAKKYHVSKRVEKRLEKWSNDNSKIIIAGHTHRPIMPLPKTGLYINDGSCIHPNGITSLEIDKGFISLVKWFYDVNDQQVITVKRELLSSSIPIEDYFL